MFNYRTLAVALTAFLVASPVFAVKPAVAETTKVAEAANSSVAVTLLKMNLNKSDLKELMKVKGMSAAKARKIVSYRKKHGDFKSMDYLKKVKGFAKMKPALKKAVDEQLTV